MRLSPAFVSAALALSLFAGCSKDPPHVDDQGGMLPPQTPSAKVPDDFGGMQPVDASAAPATSAMPSASTEAAATALATGKPAASASAPATTDCGTKANPCPLQKWMKEHTQADLAAGDNAAIASDLDKIAAMAPAGYSKWASISKDGATAARAGNTDAVKASCRGCHDEYKTKYKTEMRGRAVPGT